MQEEQIRDLVTEELIISLGEGRKLTPAAAAAAAATFAKPNLI